MPMNVILLERVLKLGQMGDVVRVKPGFARNYLLPQKKALRATKDNIAYFESQRKVLEAQNLERRKVLAFGNRAECLDDHPNLGRPACRRRIDGPCKLLKALAKRDGDQLGDFILRECEVRGIELEHLTPAA